MAASERRSKATATARNSRWRKKVYHPYARIHAIGQRANATLKTWKVLTKLRCRPRRATATMHAIPV